MKQMKLLGLSVMAVSMLYGCGGGGGSNGGGGNTPVVQKTEQSVANLPTGNYAAYTTITLSSTTTNGLPLTYVSSTPNQCIIQGTNLQFLNVGTCTVSYSQKGNETYAPLNKSFSVTVSAITNADGTQKDYYELKPDVKSCKYGVINDKTRQDVLAEVNEIRKLHNLPSLTYNKDLEVMMAQTALSMAAQNTTSHSVDSSWNCYSDMAVTGAEQSSLYSYVSTSEKAQFDPIVGLDGLMRENYSVSLGHRRWLMSPFIKETSFGMADGVKKVGTGYTFGAALHMYNPANYMSQSTTAPTGIYPYPVGNYPSRLYKKGDRMSLFVLYDQSSYTKNRNVDYSKATITIKDLNGKAYTVNGIQYDREGQGVPNNMSFLMPDFEYNVDYRVNVDNVMVNGTQSNYQYDFKVIQ